MNKPTNKTIIKTYLRHYNHSIQSQKMRKSSLNYFFNGFNYNGHIFEIDTEKLIDYFDWLKTQDVALTTKKNKWTILVSFLNSTMEYYRKYNFIVIIPKHSIKWGNGHKKPESNKNIVACKDELKRLLDYFKTHNYKHYLIFRLFTEMGCRKNFLLDAKYNEVNIKKRYIESKGKFRDEIYYFSKNLALHLEMYLDQRKKLENKYKHLFLNNRNEPYGLRAFNLILHNACKKLGIDKVITTHTFRRTLNTLRKTMGCSNEDRRILLNHSVNDVNLQSYTILEYENFIKIYDKWNP